MNRWRNYRAEHVAPAVARVSLYYVALPTSNRFPAHLWPDVRKSQTDGLYRNRLFDGKALADVFREIGSGVLPAFATDRQRQFGGLRY